ncbi:universal stress protein [Halorussus pelagicus]|uniref:universal stress protein n=1 Tax=Halorussus pelagicus TaxID=2505977 RepID=UPI000FFB473E|nr:universal stress protein [Halorussus pelagicus]
MSILVPFDGSDLAVAALVRATTLGDAFDETVVAVTIIPERDAEYARDHDWLGPNEEFDMGEIVAQLHEQVADVAPEADFHHEVVGRYASAGRIAKKLRRTAKSADASLVAIGSDNAGHMVSSIHSVGSSVASDEAFDVLIVRSSLPPDASPTDSPGW